MAPQSPIPVCAAEVETLREMLAEERERAGDAAECPATAAWIWLRARSERRIEALTTAIEALGGAL